MILLRRKTMAICSWFGVCNTYFTWDGSTVWITPWCSVNASKPKKPCLDFINGTFCSSTGGHNSDIFVLNYEDNPQFSSVDFLYCKFGEIKSPFLIRKELKTMVARKMQKFAQLADMQILWNHGLLK